jgi:hypothetical protein
MILGGVEPLDNDSWLTWRKVTQSFIRADIKKTLKESVQVEVSISLLSQEPRFVENPGRVLMKSRVRGIQTGRGVDSVQVKEQELTFDVNILIQSDKEEHDDARDYLANAFNSKAKQISYLRQLKATADPSFTNVEFMSVNAKPSSSNSSIANKAIAISVLVASVTVSIVFLGATLFVDARNMAHSKENVERMVDTKDSSRDQARLDTVTSSLSDQVDGICPSADDQSHSSIYWQGSIDVTLLADAAFENTPRMYTQRQFISKSESSFDESSLYTNED